MHLGRSVGELLASVSAKEVREWREFYELEPWGWEADCYVSGIVASTLANIHRDPKKRAHPFTPLYFVPKGAAAARKPVDPEVLAAKFRASFAGFAAPNKMNGEGDGGKN